MGFDIYGLGPMMAMSNMFPLLEKPLKPRIKKMTAEKWVCTGETVLGFGSSPYDAYLDWKRESLEWSIAIQKARAAPNPFVKKNLFERWF